MTRETTGSPPSGHLCDDEFHRLVARQMDRKAAFLCLLHLGSCRLCRRRMATLQGEEGRSFLAAALPEGLPLDGGPTRPQDYSSALDNALVAVSHLERKVLEEEEDAARLYRRLAAQPPSRWRLLIENQRRFRTMGMLSLVLREARRCRPADASRAEVLGRLALEICAGLPESEYDAGLIRDRTVLAWGYLASALRLQGRLDEAQRALNEGERLLPDESREALDETAWIRLLGAALYRDLGRFGEALEAAREARRLFRSLGDSRHAAKADVLRAEALEGLGQDREATRLLQTTLTAVSPEAIGEATYHAAVGRLVACLTRAGDGSGAAHWRQRLEELEPSAETPCYSTVISV